MRIALPLLFVVLAFGQTFESARAVPQTDRPPLTCATILCLEGYTCKDNKCVKNSKITCANVRCKGGYKCLENPARCVKIGKCDTVKCREGYVCIEGKCERIFIHPIRTTPPPEV